MAISIQPGEPEPRLVWQAAPDPRPSADEAILQVAATAVNRADLAQARGHYPPPPGASPILGLEAAGTVLEVGSRVAGWQLGDRACALLSGGGYAERVAVPHEMLLRLPDSWPFERAAAVPEAWYTAFVNLILEGQLAAGETALIHAGASGVGTAAIQLATQLGALPIATAGSDEKIALCRQLGAKRAINYKREEIRAAVLEATAGQGVDLILDPVGADYLELNLALLRPKGRLVLIGLLSGSAARLDLNVLLRQRLRLIGSVLRTRSLAEKIAITRAFRERVWPHLLSGELRPIVDRVFPISQAADAHEYVRQNRSKGKVVLAI
ncbi:MAG: NAD(P)H-quinone oxidoreductase [Candidatus Promineifilaceae bacterium]